MVQCGLSRETRCGCAVLGSIWWDRLLANPESTAATHSVGLRFGSFSKLDIKLYALSLTVCLMKVSAILLV